MKNLRLFLKDYIFRSYNFFMGLTFDSLLCADSCDQSWSIRHGKKTAECFQVPELYRQDLGCCYSLKGFGFWTSWTLQHSNSDSCKCCKISVKIIIITLMDPPKHHQWNSFILQEKRTTPWGRPTIAFI